MCVRIPCLSRVDIWVAPCRLLTSPPLLCTVLSPAWYLRPRPRWDSFSPTCQRALPPRAPVGEPAWLPEPLVLGGVCMHTFSFLSPRDGREHCPPFLLSLWLLGHCLGQFKDESKENQVQLLILLLFQRILTPRLLEPHTSSFISSGDETAGRCADWYLCLLTHAAAQSRPLLPPLCALGNWEGTTEALRMGGGVWAPLDALLSNRCSLGCFLHFSFLFLVVLLSAVCYSTIAPSRNPGMDIIHFEKFKNISNCP